MKGPLFSLFDGKIGWLLRIGAGGYLSFWEDEDWADFASFSRELWNSPLKIELFQASSSGVDFC